MKQDDKSTSVAQLKSSIQAFCEERKWDPYHTPKDLAIGLVTEGSELLEIFRFVAEGDLPALMETAEARAAIADELADSLFFVLRFSQLYGFDLAECLAQKLVKNAKKYPAR